MKKHLLTGCLLFVLAGIGFLLWHKHREDSQVDSAQTLKALERGVQIPLPGNSKSSPSRLLGHAKSAPGTGPAAAALASLGSPSSKTATTHAAIPAPLVAPVSKLLTPKAPVLSARQIGVLQQLRWGEAKDLEWRMDGDDATVRMLASPVLAAPDVPGAVDMNTAGELAVRFIDRNKDLFLLTNPVVEVAVASVSKDPVGGAVVRLNQFYKGLRVWPASLTANVSDQGYLTVLTASYTPTPEGIITVATVASETAVQSARHVFASGETGDLAPGTFPSLIIYVEKGRASELAYDIHVRLAGEARRVLVSATTGDVLRSYSEICDLETTVPDFFGTPRTINVTALGSPVKYYNTDTTKLMYSGSVLSGFISIYDKGQSGIPLCYSSSLDSGFNPAAVSLSYYLGKTYDFYLSVFKLNSFDGNGATIRGLINAPDEKTNGVMKNAFWQGQSQLLVFGAADAYVGAPDVIAHEFAHAVDEHSADLLYFDESGALNESFSDVLGEAFEAFLTGSNDWIMGTMLKEKIRDMKTPATYGQPSRMSQFVRTSVDNGGVHVNSGIPNHAFYLLAEGLGSGSIGMQNARDIFYRALSTKLNSRSDFQDLRSACILASNELFGSGSKQSLSTASAFNEVEIYDSSLAGIPQDFSPPSGAESFLISYKAVDGNFYLGRREDAKLDGSTLSPISKYPMSTKTRPSVSGDGSLAVFVDSAYNGVVAATDGSFDDRATTGGYFNSISISADSKYLLAVARDPATGLTDNKLLYLNIASGHIESIDLYLPVADGPNTVQITAVDEIDLSPDGQLGVFDGYAKTVLGDGTVLQSWAVFAIDLKTKGIYLLVDSMGSADIGSPSFSRTSSSRVCFECRAKSANLNSVITASLTTDKMSAIGTHADLPEYFAFPRFSAADDSILYTDSLLSPISQVYQPNVIKIKLLADKLTFGDAAQSIQTLAISGLCYRRGVFAGPPVLTVRSLNDTLSKGASGAFRITRSAGDMTIAVPVSFKVLGTAQSGVDYSPITLQSAIPAGVTFVDVPIQAAGTLSAGLRTLTLSLDPQIHYVVAPGGGEASMRIGMPEPPVISSQPGAQRSAVGGTVSFSVSTTDDLGNSYQWYKNNVKIAGATSRIFTIVKVGDSDAGVYTCVVSNSAGSVITSGVSLSVGLYSAIVNVSVRTTMAAGQNLIVGAVVSGGPKDMLVRAAGPALNAFGLVGMADPRLELFTTGSTSSAQNDDWQDNMASVFDSVGAFAFVKGSKDAAFTQSIQNSFTVHCKGTGPGTVLVEAYDIKGGTSSRLVNVSARNHVGKESDVLIAGFTIGGNGTKKLLIRGVGPTLSTFTVPGVLNDPKLQVFNSDQKVIAENDNWSPALTSVFDSVGAFALTAGSKDAALLITLDAGASYTVMLSGADGGTGEGLIEVYEVP